MKICWPFCCCQHFLLGTVKSREEVVNTLIWGHNDITNEISIMSRVRHNIGKKPTYHSQFSSNSNKISLFILKNLIFTSDKNLILSLKILKRWFHQEWWHHIKLYVLVLHLLTLLNPRQALRQNLASLILFSRYYFDRCSSELAELVPLPHSCGRSTRYSNRLHDFSVTIPRC